jgi:hypothetical protein
MASAMHIGLIFPNRLWLNYTCVEIEKACRLKVAEGGGAIQIWSFDPTTEKSVVALSMAARTANRHRWVGRIYQGERVKPR